MESEAGTIRRAKNRQAMENFMAAIGAQDFVTLEAVCQPDLLVELPYSDPPRRIDGVTAYRAAVEPSLEIFQFSLSVTALHEMTDPDALF